MVKEFIVYGLFGTVTIITTNTLEEAKEIYASLTGFPPLDTNIVEAKSIRIELKVVTNERRIT